MLADHNSLVNSFDNETIKLRWGSLEKIRSWTVFYYFHKSGDCLQVIGWGRCRADVMPTDHNSLVNSLDNEMIKLRWGSLRQTVPQLVTIITFKEKV